MASLRDTVAALLRRVLGDKPIRWRPTEFKIVNDAQVAAVKLGARWVDVVGAGMLKRPTLRQAGFDVGEAAGFAFGVGIDRLAMIRFEIDDIRKLWQPPYLPTSEIVANT